MGSPDINLPVVQNQDIIEQHHTSQVMGDPQDQGIFTQGILGANKFFCREWSTMTSWLVQESRGCVFQNGPIDYSRNF